MPRRYDLIEGAQMSPETNRGLRQLRSANPEARYRSHGVSGPMGWGLSIYLLQQSAPARYRRGLGARLCCLPGNVRRPRRSTTL